MDLSSYKKLYKSIGTVKCPYFDDELVYFNRKGFNHMLRSGKNPRLSEHQEERLRLLPICKEVLSEDHIFVQYRIIRENDAVARFWAFDSHKKGIEVKLVVRQIDAGTKHFFSIFPIKH